MRRRTRDSAGNAIRCAVDSVDEAGFVKFTHEARSSHQGSEQAGTRIDCAAQVIAARNSNLFWAVHSPITFFIAAITFGRLVQNFLGQRFHLVAVNELRFETLLFGIGNELGACERFGICRAEISW